MAARRRPRRWYALFGVLCLLGTAYLVGRRLAAPHYQGPVTDHFDGREFHNLGVVQERGRFALVRWWLTGRPVKWPKWRDIPPAQPPPARDAGLRVTFVNHATVLVQIAGMNLVTDPVWSDRVGPAPWLGTKRHKAPGLAWEDLPRIDVILISHNHYDHLDLPTIARIVRRDEPVILSGLGTRRLLERHGLATRAVDLDWWQSNEVGNVRVTFTPAQHWGTRGLGDRKRALWGSFFIQGAGRSVYFAGDTGAGPHLKLIRARLGPPTVALLPIGSYEPRWFMRPQHMNPEEAVAAHLTLGAARSLGIHWGTFDQTDEGMDDPPAALAQAVASVGLADDAFVALENGGALNVR